MTGKDIFKFDTIAVTGDFGPNRTSEKMKSWIQHHAGRFAHDISSGVTHLICSKEHFNKEVAMVEHAKQHKHIKIVSFDWLEDSLLSTPQKRKPEKPYLLNTLMEVKAARKTKKKAVRKENIEQSIKKFDKSCRDFEKDMFSDGYHIYRDHTTFAYDITLARVDLTTNKNQRYSLKVNTNPLVAHNEKKNIHPPPSHTASPIPSSPSTITNPYASPLSQTLDGRLDDLSDISPPIASYLPPSIPLRPPPPIYPSYLPTQLPHSPRCPRIRAYIRHPRCQRLQLYESHNTPKRYACYVKYSATHEPTRPEMVAPINSSFEVAFEAFKRFFRLKVGGEWDLRLGGDGGGGGRLGDGNNGGGLVGAHLRGGGGSVGGGSVGGGDGAQRVRAAGEATSAGEGFFFYRPPKEGSRGVVKGESVVASVEGGEGGAVAEEKGTGSASAGMDEGDGVLAGGSKAGEN